MIEQIGEYRIERELGRGGMGVVYAGRAPAGDPVAIKVLLDAGADVELRMRFETEVAASARIQHPNVVRLLDAGRQQGRPFLVLELLEGVSLAERLKQEGLLPIPAAVDLIAQLAEALEAVHACGVLHRDLKPSNIMLADRPVITDFGLARDPASERERLTTSGQMLGTPAYMSPEQARGERDAIGPETDVYGLGAVLYHCLTGGPPFVGSQLDVLLQVLERAPEPPSATRVGVTGELDAIVLRCLAKRAEDRYPSAVALAEALRTLSPAAPRRRGRTLALGVGGVALALGLLLVLEQGTSSAPDVAPTQPTPTPSLAGGPTSTPPPPPAPGLVEAERAAWKALRDRKSAVGREALGAVPEAAWRPQTWRLQGELLSREAQLRNDKARREQALAAFRRALTGTDADLPALRGLALLGPPSPELERVEARIQALAPGTALAVATAGLALLRSAGAEPDREQRRATVARAQREFGRALAFDPTCREAWNGRLGALDFLAREEAPGELAPALLDQAARAGRRVEALQGVEAKAYLLQRVANLLRLLGARLEAGGRREKAASLAREAIRFNSLSIALEPGFGRPHLERGLARLLLLSARGAAISPPDQELILGDLRAGAEQETTDVAAQTLALCLEKLALFQEAEAAFSRAIRLAPPGRLGMLHHERSNSRANLGWVARALEDLERSEELGFEPPKRTIRDRERMQRELPVVTEALRHLEQRSWSEALRCLDQRPARDRGAAVYLLRGRVLADRYSYLRKPQDLVEARRSFSSVCASVRDHREAHVRLALVGPTSESVAKGVRLAEGGPPAMRALAQVASARWVLRQRVVPEAAVKRCHRLLVGAIQIDPECEEAFIEVSRLLGRLLGRPLTGEALRTSEESLRRISHRVEQSSRLRDSPRLQVQLGAGVARRAATLNSQALFQQAKARFTKALELEERYVMALRYRAQALKRLGRLEQAKSDLLRARKLAPWDLGLLDELVILLVQAEAFEEAESAATARIQQQATPRAYRLRAQARRGLRKAEGAASDDAAAAQLEQRSP